MSPARNYLVGYGRPPAQHRFKTGVSGNPRGRPRKADAPAGAAAPGGLDDLILAEARRPVRVVENGRSVARPTIQVVVRELCAAAARGDHRAQLALLKAFRTAETNVAERQRADRDAVGADADPLVEFYNREALRLSGSCREAEQRLQEERAAVWRQVLAEEADRGD